MNGRRKERRMKEKEQMAKILEAWKIGFPKTVFPKVEEVLDEWNPEIVEKYQNIWGMEYGKKLGEMIWDISKKIDFPELFLDVIWEYSQICEYYEDPEVSFMDTQEQEELLNLDFANIMINEEQIKIWVEVLESGYKERIERDPEYYLKTKIEKFIGFFKNLINKKEK